MSSPLTNEKCIHSLCEVVDVLINKHLKEIKKNPSYPLFSYPLTSSLELLKTFNSTFWDQITWKPKDEEFLIPVFDKGNGFCIRRSKI